MKHFRFLGVICLSISVLLIFSKSVSSDANPNPPKESQKSKNDSLGVATADSLRRALDRQSAQRDTGQASVSRRPPHIEVQDHHLKLQAEKIINNWKSPENRSKIDLHRQKNMEALRSRNGIIDVSIAHGLRKQPDPIDLPHDPNAEFYYFFGDRKIPLMASEDEVAVKFHDQVSEGEKASLLGSSNRFHSFKQIDLLRLQRTEDRRQKLRNLRASGRVAFANPKFSSSSGMPIVVTDEMIVKFMPIISQSGVEAFNEKVGVEIVSELNPESFRNLYLVRVSDPKSKNALDLANTIHQESIIEFAHPNFLIKTAYLSMPTDDPYFGPSLQDFNDPFRPYQSFLFDPGPYAPSPKRYDIGILDAWDITKGDPNVIISILDSGIDYGHEDFVPWNTKFVAGYDTQDPIHNHAKPQWPVNNWFGYYNPDSAATSSTNAHGTTVAGVAAGVGNNGIGISGVAPDAKLMSVQVGVVGPDSTWLTSTSIANGITVAKANGGSIINMSVNVFNTPNLQLAVEDAYQNGRNGLGCVLVAASGNINDNFWTYPAKYNDVVGVGGVLEGGQRWVVSNTNLGSTWGSQVEVVGFSTQIGTTDITGSLGFTPGGSQSNNDNYSRVNGTSYAAPQVSGLAALIMAVNNDSARVIREYIKMGARDLIGQADEDEWGYDHHHGNGIISARNSVELAVNKAYNPNFEADSSSVGSPPSNWGFYDPPTSFTVEKGDGSIFNSTLQGAAAGFHSLKIDATDSTKMAYSYFGTYSQGQELTASVRFKAKSQNSNYNPYIYLALMDYYGNEISYDYGLYKLSGSEWQTVQVNHKVQGSNAMMYLIIGSFYPTVAALDLVTVREGRSGYIANGGFEYQFNVGWWLPTGPWAMNNTWPLNNPQYGGQVGLEGGLCAGTNSPESGTGVLGSRPFIIQKPYINFKIGGHDGQQNNSQLNKVELRRVDNNEVLRRTFPPGTNDLVQRTWDVSDLEGVEVTIDCRDGHNGSGWAWLSVDDFSFDYVAKDTPSGAVSPGGGSLTNGDFESGDLSGWNPVTPWAINNTWPLHNPQHGPQLGLQGSYCAGTNQQEWQTGTMTSNHFVIDQPYINFKIGGHDGQNNNDGHNKVELWLVGNPDVLLFTESTPGTNDLMQKSWYVGNRIGQTVYIACVDNHSGGGHAWISIDDVHLSGSAAKPTVVQANGELGKDNMPDEFVISQNAPNPFNPETSISYALPQDAEVKIVIYNTLGQPVRTLVDQHKSAGRYSAIWDSRDDLGRQVASGIYLYQIIAGEFAETKKMLILK